MRRLLSLLCLLAIGLPLGSACAGEDAPAAKDAPLCFLRLNRWGAEEWFRMKDGAVVIRIPGGEYLRRPYEGWEASEEPEPFRVASFYVDKYEVTNAQFAAFLNDQETVHKLVWPAVGGLVYRHDGKPPWAPEPGRERHPVTAATGRGALAYAKWAGARLPTAPEWEKAAGGPGGRMYPWGEERPDEMRANYGRPAPWGSMPVGSYAAGASPYGALDMAGNVYERVMIPEEEWGLGPPDLLKGGSWLSTHPLNLRVLDMCMQPLHVAEGSVGFRCAMTDPDPDRPSRRIAEQPTLRLAARFEEAVEEARRRRVPIFLSLQYDTCGQCDRTRKQCFEDPRFVAYCNEHLVVIVGHQPGDAFEDPHPPGKDDACPLYPGITCDQHELLFAKGLAVVGDFVVSPGNFVLHPDRVRGGAGKDAILVGEDSFPKWGNAVDVYLMAFDSARRLFASEED